MERSSPFDTDTLGENSVKFLNKKYGLPEDTSKNSFLFRQKYQEDFAKNIEIAKQEQLAKNIAKGVTEGIDKSKIGNPNYSTTGKVINETNITNKNTRIYPFTSADVFNYVNQ